MRAAARCAATVAQPTTFDASTSRTTRSGTHEAEHMAAMLVPTSRRCAEGVQVSGQRPRTPHGEPGAKNAAAFFVCRLGVESGAVGAKVAPQLS